MEKVDVDVLVAALATHVADELVDAAPTTATSAVRLRTKDLILRCSSVRQSHKSNKASGNSSMRLCYLAVLLERSEASRDKTGEHMDERQARSIPISRRDARRRMFRVTFLSRVPDRHLSAEIAVS